MIAGSSTRLPSSGQSEPAWLGFCWGSISRSCDSTFASIPALDEIKAVSGGGTRILVGGHDFDPPAVTLHLAPGLPEHVWIEDGWVHRLVIPNAHMIVDWRSP